MTRPVSQTMPLRPADEDVDVFGLTHVGLVRSNNEDQFLIASLHKTMYLHDTSLEPDQLPPLISSSRGFVFLVADGVGGRPGGKKASGTAVRVIADYVTHTMRFYSHHDPAREQLLLEELERSVLRSDEVIREEAEGTATTLTMVVVMWPRAYLIQVGDSRCYRLRVGQLEQLSKDQTIAQALVDAGALAQEKASASPLAHVLSSALGAREARPVITVTDAQWDDVMLLCTDGLTKHVSDAEIAEQLRTSASSEHICRNLLQLTLDRGATDNVTIVAGRVRDRRKAKR
ncbi:MAG: PP2C family protein-serine/threonine phosphatase [Gemmatimonadota bacterium]